ncbi:MFS transporter [Streptomonospora sp. S1-112]|uniref:MFS transporter n=1 Tax=Streptomonospora mangrovi TaxID=2883123 RepID=A0A9X3NSL5_9ACTN|nr:MFS transporter [Streptomonospora mangrovi]MDA0566090.1 MFS transporter [Streptomonospora mangrovi]
MLLYPVYALLFADTGLSTAQIASLFAVWSVTGIVLEVPSGVLADMVSRRRMLTVAPLLTGAGFAMWTLAPGYPAFALGFVLWGAGTALHSGTLQALVYTELTRIHRARAGAPPPEAPLAAPDDDAEPDEPDGWVSTTYARLIGRSRAVAAVAVLLATAVAVPVMALGGYQAVGAVSVLTTAAGALVGRTFPEHPRPAPDTARTGAGVRAVLAELRAAAASARGVLGHGLGEVARSAALRRALVLLSVLLAALSMDEFIPLLVRDTGVPTALVPLYLLPFTVASVVGGWLAGRGGRWTVPVLVATALCQIAGALSGHPAGLLLVAAAFGAAEWAVACAEARLQDGVGDRARATVTSMSGFGGEAATVCVFAAYGLGSVWLGAGPLFALAALPYLAVAAALGRRTVGPGR